MKSLLLFICMFATMVDVSAKEFVEESNTVFVENVYFNQGSASIETKYRETLQALPQGQTIIIGRASSEGNADSNMVLSRKRADTVNGVLGRKFSSVSYVGDTLSDEFINVMDRRVVIKVTQTELVNNPIFTVTGKLQGVLSTHYYNVIPLR